jgi:hypothetical protein
LDADPLHGLIPRFRSTEARPGPWGGVGRGGAGPGSASGRQDPDRRRGPPGTPSMRRRVVVGEHGAASDQSGGSTQIWSSQVQCRSARQRSPLAALTPFPRRGSLHTCRGSAAFQAGRPSQLAGHGGGVRTAAEQASVQSPLDRLLSGLAIRSAHREGQLAQRIGVCMRKRVCAALAR